jgi:hypothetical protein
MMHATAGASQNAVPLMANVRACIENIHAPANLTRRVILMSKTIKIKSCKVCPHFSSFPAEYYEGECVCKNNYPIKIDTRINDKDSVPRWCPL